MKLKINIRVTIYLTNLAYKDDIILSKQSQYTCIVGKEAVKLPRHRISEIDDNKINIVHIMADGTIRDSVEGYEIPYSKETSIAYELLAKWTIEKQKKANS